LRPEIQPPLLALEPRSCDKAWDSVRRQKKECYRNYLILYRIEPNQIRVLRVLHAAQDWTQFFESS
jgi:plasmid stabilization system protein ParE